MITEKCRDLEKKVELEIQLPKIRHEAFIKLEASRWRLERLVRVFAKEMGVKEVFFPQFNELNGCEIEFERADVNDLEAWFSDRDIYGDGETFLGKVYMVTLNAWGKIGNIHFPIAIDERWDVKPTFSLGSIMLYESFIEKNPQVIEALKKALDVMHKSASSTYDVAVKFHRVLALVGVVDG